MSRYWAIAGMLAAFTIGLLGGALLVPGGGRYHFSTGGPDRTLMLRGDRLTGEVQMCFPGRAGEIECMREASARR